jgi:hypothetical protein
VPPPRGSSQRFGAWVTQSITSRLSTLLTMLCEVSSGFGPIGPVGLWATLTALGLLSQIVFSVSTSCHLSHTARHMHALCFV